MTAEHSFQTPLFQLPLLPMLKKGKVSTVPTDWMLDWLVTIQNKDPVNMVTN